MCSSARFNLRLTIQSMRPAIAAPTNEAGGSYAMRRTMRTAGPVRDEISRNVKPPSCLINPDSETQPISSGRCHRLSRSTLLSGNPKAFISTS
jgi:hypothetical protein